MRDIVMFDSHFRFSMQKTYFCLCLDQVQRYESVKKEIERLETDSVGEDKAHIVQMNREVQEEKREEVVVAPIISAAMALEAFSYDYAATNLGGNYARRHVDPLPVVSRFVVAAKLVTGQEFPTDGDAYEGLKGLMEKRNQLVHFKSKQFDMNNPNEYIDYREKFITDLEEWAHRSPGVVRAVVAEVDKLHGDEGRYALSIEPTQCHA